MRRHFTLVAILSTLSVGGVVRAGDFRVANIGESCSAIAEQETALGSRQIPSKAAGTIEFVGDAYGREVEIVYLCSKGALSTGNYFFPFQDVREAFASFDDVYKQLSTEYGPPVVDRRAGTSDEVAKLKVEDVTMRTVTVWEGSRLSVTAGIASYAESDGGCCRVYIAVWRRSSGKPEANSRLEGSPEQPSNTSLERTRDR